MTASVSAGQVSGHLYFVAFPVLACPESPNHPILNDEPFCFSFVPSAMGSCDEHTGSACQAVWLLRGCVTNRRPKGGQGRSEARRGEANAGDEMTDRKDEKAGGGSTPCTFVETRERARTRSESGIGYLKLGAENSRRFEMVVSVASPTASSIIH